MEDPLHRVEDKELIHHASRSIIVKMSRGVNTFLRSPEPLPCPTAANRQGLKESARRLFQSGFDGFLPAVIRWQRAAGDPSPLSPIAPREIITAGRVLSKCRAGAAGVALIAGGGLARPGHSAPPQRRTPPPSSRTAGGGLVPPQEPRGGHSGQAERRPRSSPPRRGVWLEVGRAGAGGQCKPWPVCAHPCGGLLGRRRAAPTNCPPAAAGGEGGTWSGTHERPQT